MQDRPGPLSIYVASSWRNIYFPMVATFLHECGHDVYDFRKEGFGWSEVDEGYRRWTVEEYLIALKHPAAERGFHRDFAAMQRADVTVCVLPCGASAHLELGWAAGAGKKTAVLMLEQQVTNPELMYKACDNVFTDIGTLADWLDELEPATPPAQPTEEDIIALGYESLKRNHPTVYAELEKEGKA